VGECRSHWKGSILDLPAMDFVSLLTPASATAVAAAFLASLVEFVEALTIVLAVGIVRGWRPAFIGTGAGVGLLLVLILLFGPLLAIVPIDALRIVVGILLLLFGLRWLRKAILRASGIIGLHDEEAAFATENEALKAAGPVRKALSDPVSILTTFKAVVLEGVEVVFIVIAVGSTGGQLLPASLGAMAAGTVVVILGLVLHRPLTRIPENLLKFAVGILISAFGTFWFAEGLGFAWPGDDLAIPGLALLILAAALAGVALARGQTRGTLAQ
jgi:uncharacterized membrane protein